MQALKRVTVEGLLEHALGSSARDEAAATARLGREALGARTGAAQACARAAMAWALYQHQRPQLEVRIARACPRAGTMRHVPSAECAAAAQRRAWRSGTVGAGRV